MHELWSMISLKFCVPAILKEKDTPCLGLAPREESLRQICMQEAFSECSYTPTRQLKSNTKEREKVSFDEIATKVLSNPMGSPTTGLCLHNCPRGYNLCPASTNCWMWLPPVRGQNPSQKAVGVGMSMLQNWCRWDNSHQQQTLPEAESVCASVLKRFLGGIP